MPLKKLIAFASPLTRHEYTATRILLALMLLFGLLTSGFDWQSPRENSASVEGSLAMKLEWGGLFLLAGVLMLRHIKLALRDLSSVNIFLLIMFVWCSLSFFWSPYPDITLKHVSQLYGVLIIAIVLQWPSNSFELFIKYVLFSLMVLMVLSFITVIVDPAVGLENDIDNAWRGVMGQKNEAGQIAAFAVLFWQVLACIKQVPRRILFAGLLFSALMLVMSKSSTSVLMGVLSSLVFHLFRKKYIYSHFWLIRIFLVALIIIVVNLQLFYAFNARLPTWDEIASPVTSIFGKGTDLTGRTQIWELVNEEITRHPLAGLGYASFWLGPGSMADHIINVLYWIPLQSHNGYLDIVNEQGYIGLILIFLTFILHSYHLFRLAHFDRLQTAYLSAMFVIVVASNITESGIFRGVGYQHIFFIISTIATTSALRRHQQLWKENNSKPTKTKNRLVSPGPASPVPVADQPSAQKI